jgi:protoporphyrinogen oxidase
MADIHIVIIGGGPCGLGAAWRLHELEQCGLLGTDIKWTLVDAGSEPGGLASSVVDEEGFTWDLGGHVLFSHYQYFTDLTSDLMGDGFSTLQRNACAIMQNQFVPYPVQLNLHRLNESDQVRCVDGLRVVDSDRKSGKAALHKPKDFQEWLLANFGTGLCNVFMNPYNFKVWAHEPKQMNVEWMGERVAAVDLARILNTIAMKEDDVTWGPNSTFSYPLHGGTGSIWRALAAALPKDNIKVNTRVESVHVSSTATAIGNEKIKQEQGETEKSQFVTTTAGESIHFTHLLSTIPLDTLCRSVEGQTEASGLSVTQLSERAADFVYSSSHIIGLGIDGVVPDALAERCWMYFPESNCPFYRVTVFSNYSPNHVPRVGQQWSLICEVSESKHKPVDIDSVVRDTIQGCINTGLITRENKIVSQFHRRLERGYPTPWLTRDAVCTPIFETLEKHKIKSRGRFGAWKYEASNQDHSFMQGVEAVDSFLFGAEEVTFHHTGIVNAMELKSNRQLQVLPSKSV